MVRGPQMGFGVHLACKNMGRMLSDAVQKQDAQLIAPSLKSEQ